MAAPNSSTQVNPARSLTLRFSALLSLFVALLGGTYLVVSNGLTAKEHDSLLVNLAGRQRMLTEKYGREINLALARLAVDDGERAKDAERAAAVTAGLFEATLAALLDGGEVDNGDGERIQLPPIQGSEIIEQLRRTEAEWLSLRRAGALALKSHTARHPSRGTGGEVQTARTLAEMDHAVLLVQQRSEAKLRRVDTLMRWAIAVGALLFAATVTFVRTTIVTPLGDTMTTLSLTNVRLRREAIQREAAETTLREQEALISSVLETAADGIITIDGSGTIGSANDSACRIFGYAAAEIIGHNVQMLMPAVFRERHEKALGRYLETGERKIIGNSREVVGLRKNGTVFPMELAVGEAKLGKGRLFSGIIRDLEEERGKDERLGHMLKLFVDATDPIVIGDLEGRIIDLNDEVVRAYGYSREELLGEPFMSLVPPEHDPMADDLLRCCLDGEEVRSVEIVHRTKAGRDIPVLLSISLLTDENGLPNGIASHAKDVSEQKELQAQLLQAQKLEAMGTLAGGIAHDFNNLLTSILGSSEILTDQLEPGGRLARSAQRIQKAAERAAALTTRLLGFSRKQVTQRVGLDLNRVVEEIEELFVRTLSENVEFKTDLASEGLHVLADEGQLGQVLMNLVVNAGDAMPTGGKLLLTTVSEQIPGDRARMLDIPPGRYVALRVRDSGEGIAPEVLSQIFDPFFTTKEVDKGTGLGLSTSLGIIREHAGAIAVESEVGVGTTFTILLPEVEPSSTIEAEPVGAAPPRTQASGETILLVEDDEIMRDLLSEVLEEEGYNVVVAPEPVEALSLSSALDGGIALVVTDVVMPSMSGFLLARELRAQRPQIRILYMSGYTDQMLADQGDLRDDDPFIRKPFGNDTLLAKVREVLDA
ncbi:MAG: PAS domain S-box protein [Deltaproteobacteria bacterium]|nr:PAS domain S-box protein [Deltaproteobacteria bacterium]